MGQEGFEGFVSFVGWQAAVSERDAGEAHVVHRLAVMVCDLGPGRNDLGWAMTHSNAPNYVTCCVSSSEKMQPNPL